MLRPEIEQRFIDLHAGMADVAHEGKVSGGSHFKRKIGFALAGL